LSTYWEVDGGFVDFDAFEANEKRVILLAPVSEPKDKTRDRYAPLPTDSPVIAAWRERMGTQIAQVLYKLRAATAECINAQARQQHGVQQVTVRSLAKVRCIAKWVALAHNLYVWIQQTRTPTRPHTLERLGQAEGVALPAH
jgi:hypothetical protein